MARKEKYIKQDILNSGVEFVKRYGIEFLNARNIAKFIGCSTQPIFRNYNNLDEYKKDLKKSLHKDYEFFISRYIDKENYLLTISYAYALYAKKEPNSFNALFMTELAGTRTISEVINTERNRDTIESTKEKFKINIEDAENLYRDVRFYTHGIACQLCCKSIKMTDIELYNLISDIIEHLK